MASQRRCRKNLPLCDSGNPIDREFTQSEWDSLIERFPAGTHVVGVVAATPVYGVWVTLDDLPDVPALLEIIHFAVIESDPTHRIEHPRDYPPVGTRVSARILAWCQTPKDVRLTQLSHLDWVHNHSENDAEP